MCYMCGIRSVSWQRIFLIEVNDSCNHEIQTDITVAYIKKEKFEILNIIDVETGYGTKSVLMSRSVENIEEDIEDYSINQHGAPKYFSGDREFCKLYLVKILGNREIEHRLRSSRSSHMNGKIERSNGTSIMILEKVFKEKCIDAAIPLVSGDSSIRNALWVYSVDLISSSSRGKHSIIELSTTNVPGELFKAHVELSANRTLGKPNPLPHWNYFMKEEQPVDTKVWVLWYTSRQSERTRWLLLQWSEQKNTLSIVKEQRKDPQLTVGYGHIRLDPKGELANDLMEIPL